MKKVIVLAYSGGLDTSYCLKYLSDQHEIHAVTVNTGGFDDDEIAKMRERALLLGAACFEVLDETASYYEKGIRFLLFGNVLKNGTYPLSVSAERVFQAMAIATYASVVKAHAIAHGSTGAGNDQIRFDSIFQSMCPGVEIITPIRDQALTRAQEIKFLQDQGVNESWEKAMYSINKGLWGTSVGGKETLTSDVPLPEKAFPTQLNDEGVKQISIGFEKGDPVMLNGEQLSPVRLIEQLNELAGNYAIGRDMHVGDTIIGIKGRVGFEAPAATVLIRAHHLLEKHTLSKNQLFIKDHLAQWYGNLMHEGQYLDPVMRDIEAFFEKSQKYVTGSVDIRLSPYRFEVLGVRSEFDLMQSDFAKYGEENTGWSGSDARGFATIFSNQMKLIKSVQDGKG